MAEYIDKTKLIADGWVLNRTYPYDERTMVYETMEITDIPSADVAPVVHGHWVNVRVSARGDSAADCNQCGTTVHTSFSDNVNFCPNCGARMDKEEV